MFIRLKDQSNNEVNIMASAIAYFTPNGDGSIVTMNNGTAFAVQESNRSIRHRLNKITETIED